jgi:hypothetical protein
MRFKIGFSWTSFSVDLQSPSFTAICPVGSQNKTWCQALCIYVSVLCTSSNERTLVTDGINFYRSSEEKTFYKDKSYEHCGLMGYDITQFYRWHQCQVRTCCFHPYITSNVKTQAERFPLNDYHLRNYVLRQKTKTLISIDLKIMYKNYIYVTRVINLAADACKN